jgi:hypothetical protein
MHFAIISTIVMTKGTWVRAEGRLQAEARVSNLHQSSEGKSGTEAIKLLTGDKGFVSSVLAICKIDMYPKISSQWKRILVH